MRGTPCSIPWVMRGTPCGICRVCEVYLLVYAGDGRCTSWYMPPYVHSGYTTLYTLPTHPGYTTIIPTMPVTAVHGLSMQSCSGDGALGSEGKKPLGGSLSAPHSYQSCDEECARLRRVTPALQREGQERSDRRRVFPPV